MASFNFDDFVNRLRALANDIGKESPKEALRLALTTIGNIENRIQTTGVFGDGEKHTYSEGYKKRRKKEQGQTSNFVNLTFTGDMWEDIKGRGAAKTTKTGEGFTVTVSAQSQDAKNKLEWNEARYSDVLEVTESEQSDLQSDVDFFIQGLVNKYFA